MPQSQPINSSQTDGLSSQFQRRWEAGFHWRSMCSMLLGTPADVVAASRKAIDDAAAGGRFILSTGDQCGRDTPDENLFAMIETARTYGRY